MLFESAHDSTLSRTQVLQSRHYADASLVWLEAEEIIGGAADRFPRGVRGAGRHALWK